MRKTCLRKKKTRKKRFDLYTMIGRLGDRAQPMNRAAPLVARCAWRKAAAQSRGRAENFECEARSSSLFSRRISDKPRKTGGSGSLDPGHPLHSVGPLSFASAALVHGPIQKRRL